jgi:hypothetical protein
MIKSAAIDEARQIQTEIQRSLELTSPPSGERSFLEQLLEMSTSVSI